MELPLRAEMIHGGCLVESERTPGVMIRVTDELELTDNRLLINDCGFDADGNFVYGNQRGVPYDLTRVLEGSDLEWTCRATSGASS